MVLFILEKQEVTCALHIQNCFLKIMFFIIVRNMRKKPV